MPSYTIFPKKHNWGIVKYQALLVSPKFSYLVALL